MTETAVDDAIRSLLVPVEDAFLLLPGSVVAEVIAYSQPRPPTGAAPPWYLGQVDWRGQAVPCLSFERLNGAGGMSGVPSRARLVILKGLTERPRLPYVALLARHIPRLLNVGPHTLEPLDDPELRNQPAVQDVAVAQGETALIPDLEFIESHAERVA